jgi:Xaa-Pro aminopeptidase
MDGLTPEQEWAKALSHELLYTEIINHWGCEIFYEYGSYANCAPWQRDRILVWLRKKPYYIEYLEKLDAVEAQAAAEAQVVAVEAQAAAVVEAESRITDLENKITYLEATFAHLKEMRARKGKDGASSSKA